MRKLVLTLAVVAICAAPVLADVEITLEDLGDGLVAIGYDASAEDPMLVRAFALNIAATGGNIIDINDYAVGDDNGGYGVFPGSFAAAPIQVDPQTGEVVTWEVDGYTPVAPADDPDAEGEIPGPSITIEMGSLYDENAPPAVGVLCTITVDSNVTEVCVTGNAIRGNVVMEDASEATVVYACISLGACYPSDYPAYDVWVAFGKPDCWCYARNCHGDADGLRYGSQWTGYYWVGTPDLGVVAAAWFVMEPPFASVEYPNGLIDVPNGLCADFDRTQYGSQWTGYYRVGTPDLGILADAWFAMDPPFNDPMHAAYPNGVPGDCVPVPVEP
jgi:hypothetical protein